MRKAPLLAAGCLPALSFLVLLGAHRPAASAEPKRAFQVTCEVVLPSIPDGAAELKVWVPLSRSDRNQTILRRRIQVPYPYRVARDPAYGNDILFLKLGRPLPPALEMSIRYEAVVRGERLPLEKASAETPPSVLQEMALHLGSNRTMVVDDRIRDLARSVTAGAETPLAKARAIYRYVIERMRYDKETPGWGRGDTLRACEVGAGNCTDFHSLFISLARAAGIPARFAIGLPVPPKEEGDIPGYHCWAQIYLAGVGWVPVDASEAWKDRGRMDYFFGSYDPNRIAVSLGRDIELAPEHSAGDPVNIFFFPVVELDGKVMEEEKVQTRFRFRELT